MNDKLEKITRQLIGIPKFGNGVGLHRMQYLTKDILSSEWANTIDPINIVGSNGKGSTSSIISCILSELNISNGKYTSPHLFEFTERIVVDGEEIPIEELEKLATQFFDIQKNYLSEFPDDTIGAFEAFTFIALSYFFKKNVDTVVLEAGIGGRFDSTRVLTGRFSALTSIDLEHTNLLGPTKELIAFDKVDIAKEGSSIIIGDINPDVLRKLKEYAKYKNVRLYPIAEHTNVGSIVFANDKMKLDFTIEDYNFNDVYSNLIGYHQVNNILVSVFLLKKWLAKNYPKISKEQFIIATKSALKKISWIGRLEKIQNTPPTFIDVGHTPDAIRLLVSSFKEIKKQKCLLLVGVSFDKEISEIVKELLPIADAVVCTQAYHKGASVDDVFKVVEENNRLNIPIYKYEKIEDAVDFSIQYSKKNEMSILAAGGLFLAIEAYYYIKGNAPSKLNFF